ncbi:Hypothetical predicted protein [Lecanosticta acicola]|uniref:Peroxin-14 n=1 Tax=Lecanosticta acicola TaxID=111012 RepID=A0AAI8YT63_9PEZI|nr:Hypothetical predicted protein [Lecanosticta acicola]
MSDGRPKPAIPAWQRAAPKPPPATEDPVSSQPEAAQSKAAETATPEPEATESPEKEPESIPADDTSPTTVPVAAAVEPKPAFERNEFESFRQQQQPFQNTATQGTSQRPSTPPIITYPEFLVEAHKQPPLITPTRILNSVYVAGGIATLLYAASKWIINPMVATLSESRHEFLSHSQSKVDEMNERLEKLVSKLPESKKEPASMEEGAEDESITSDPTELYHRDMGTQTSPLPSRSSSLPGAAQPKEPVEYQTGALEIMTSHLTELADGAEQAEEGSRERQDRMNKLRHYLDDLIFGAPLTNAWHTSEDAITMKNGSSENDAIEDLKKEIRGVKGVLLSAKRFPAVGRSLTGAT